MMRKYRWLAFGGALFLLGMVGARADETPERRFREWGTETLKAIESAFRIPGRDLYADEATAGQPVSERPAFMWGCGVQLTALAAAARVEPKTWQEPLRKYIRALDVYWNEQGGVGGYDVLPLPKPPDRYYDDNAWIVLGLVEAAEITRDPKYREQAEKTFRYVMSGEDDKLGGGIYWRESDRASKNTCVNAPAVVSALRLYQVTRKRDYLETARRLYDWTNKTLQDADGLFFDNIRLDGTVEKTKWSYNTALMIRANVLFYSVTKEERYRKEAQRIAQAAEGRWIHPETGAFTDEAHFAHLLSEAFLDLYALDRDARRLEKVQRGLDTLHNSCRDPDGRYGKRWDTPEPKRLPTFRLIDQASAARAFWVAARYVP